jgi:hypothetical protein
MPNISWVPPRRGTARTSCREEHTTPFAARMRRRPTKSLVDEWIGWLNPDTIRLIKDTLEPRSILLDLDIPANPALIERLIRWMRYPDALYEVLR